MLVKRILAGTRILRIYTEVFSSGNPKVATCVSCVTPYYFSPGLVHIFIPHTGTPCGRGLCHQGLTRSHGHLTLGGCLASLICVLIISQVLRLVKTQFEKVLERGGIRTRPRHSLPRINPQARFRQPSRSSLRKGRYWECLFSLCRRWYLFLPRPLLCAFIVSQFRRFVKRFLKISFEKFSQQVNSHNGSQQLSSTGHLRPHN